MSKSFIFNVISLSFRLSYPIKLLALTDSLFPLSLSLISLPLSFSPLSLSLFSLLSLSLSFVSSSFNKMVEPTENENIESQQNKKLEIIQSERRTTSEVIRVDTLCISISNKIKHQLWGKIGRLLSENQHYQFVSENAGMRYGLNLKVRENGFGTIWDIK